MPGGVMAAVREGRVREGRARAKKGREKVEGGPTFHLVGVVVKVLRTTLSNLGRRVPFPPTPPSTLPNPLLHPRGEAICQPLPLLCRDAETQGLGEPESRISDFSLPTCKKASSFGGRPSFISKRTFQYGWGKKRLRQHFMW